MKLRFKVPLVILADGLAAQLPLITKTGGTGTTGVPVLLFVLAAAGSFLILRSLSPARSVPDTA